MKKNFIFGIFLVLMLINFTFATGVTNYDTATSYKYSKWECYNGETQKQGDGSSCKTYEIWQSYAKDFCENKCNNETGKCGVNSFIVDSKCSDEKNAVIKDAVTRQYNYAKWTCYNGESEKLGDGLVCKSSEEWKKEAINFCEKRCDDNGKCGVSSFGTDHDCFDELEKDIKEIKLFKYAKWQCYNGEFESYINETSCKSEDVWKSYAKHFCDGKCSNETGKCGVGGFSLSGECFELDGEIDKIPTLYPEKDIKENEEDLNETIVCKDSCLFEDSCLPIGVRVEGKYCNINGEILEQLKENSQCQNNFECSSNVCINNQCLSGNAIQKILNWFKTWFGKNN